MTGGRISFIGALVVGLSLAVWVLGYTKIGHVLLAPLVEAPWARPQIEESQRRGDVIVAALEKYRAEQGAYPPTLEAIVPRYLARIEPPTAGMEEWVYHITGDTYRLAFGSRRSGGSREWPYPVSFYEDGTWWMDQ